MRRRRTRRDDTKPEATWITSYGDLVTNLLTFFVLLFSYSVIDQAKLVQVVNSFREALGLLPKWQGVVETVSPKQTEQQQLQGLAAEVKAYFEAQGIQDKVEVLVTEEGLKFRFEQPLLFDTGEADIKPEAFPLLAKVSSLIKELKNNVRVEGHTDNLPIQTPQFPSNWELSTARAMAVLKYLVETGGVEPERLSAAGYAFYRPILPNTSEGGKAKNRRVEIVILRRFRGND